MRTFASLQNTVEQIRPPDSNLTIDDNRTVKRLHWRSFERGSVIVLHLVNPLQQLQCVCWKTMLTSRKNPNEVARVVSSGAYSYNKSEVRHRKQISNRSLIVLGVIGFSVAIYSYSHFIIFSNDCQQLQNSDMPPKKVLVIANNINEENTVV